MTQTLFFGWLVEFPDGERDWWPIEDPVAGYEVRG